MGLKHQAVTARKWRAAIRQVETHLPRPLPPLFFLTDPDRVPDPIAVARTLPRGSGVIYRHFGHADRYATATGLAHMCAQRGLCFLIAADPDLAKSVGADGVHWPEARLPQSRAWRDRFALQTASAHSRRAIWRAAEEGIDAVLVSSVFPSQSPSAGRPIGPTRLRTLAQTADLPVYGLGGITASNASRLSSVAGLASVSGLAAVSGPQSPPQAPS